MMLLASTKKRSGTIGADPVQVQVAADLIQIVGREISGALRLAAEHGLQPRGVGGNRDAGVKQGARGRGSVRVGIIRVVGKPQANAQLTAGLLSPGRWDHRPEAASRPRGPAGARAGKPAGSRPRAAAARYIRRLVRCSDSAGRRRLVAMPARSPAPDWGFAQPGARCDSRGLRRCRRARRDVGALRRGWSARRDDRRSQEPERPRQMPLPDWVLRRAATPVDPSAVHRPRRWDSDSRTHMSRNVRPPGRSCSAAG